LALVAKDHPAHLITQPFDFFWVGGTPEALREIEKLLLFLRREICRQANALSHSLVCRPHNTNMHQIAAIREYDRAS
jgi:hypothetical protein